MNKREKRTHEWFTKQGHACHTVTKPARMYLNHDIFGLHDHVVKTAGETLILQDYKDKTYAIPPNTVVFVQTKSRMMYGDTLIPYEEFNYEWQFLFVWKKVGARYELQIRKL